MSRQLPEDQIRHALEGIDQAIRATEALHEEAGSLIARASLSADLTKLERLRGRFDHRLTHDEEDFEV
jgi:hypothetical protein